MRYPVFIEPGNDTTAFGIHVPDIPGAVTAGDTFEDAWNAAIEVCQIMLEEISAQGKPIPRPSPASTYAQHPDFKGMGMGMLEIDITPYLGKTEKVNVTLPSALIRNIDKVVQQRKVKSRSAFLAQAALDKLAAP